MATQCIRAFFDHHYRHVKIDKKLAYGLHKYRVDYSVRNHEFFSGVLLGTVPLYFKDVDVMVLYRDLVDVIPLALLKEFDTCPSIPPFKITGDLYNLTLFYLAHRFLSSSLPVKIRESGAMECILLFNYRTISALTSNGFRYLADPEAAQAAYERLSNRFILKQTKSWSAYLSYRAEATLDTNGIHKKTLISLDNDLKFLYAISDSQGRIAATFKQIYRIYVEVLEDKSHIKKTSTVGEAFGEKEIAEIYSNDSTRINKVVLASNIPTNFYHEDIADVLVGLYPIITPNNLRGLILNYSKHTIGTHAKLINGFTVDSLVWCYHYLSEATLTSTERKSLPMTLAYVRNGISSSRTIDPMLLKIREDGLRVVRKIIKTDRQTILTYRTVLMLYLFLYSVRK